MPECEEKVGDNALILQLVNALIGKYERSTGYGETGPPKA